MTTRAEIMSMVLESGTFRPPHGLAGRARQWATPVALAGSFEMRAVLASPGPLDATLFFAAHEDLASWYAWILRGGEARLVRRVGGVEQEIQKSALAQPSGRPSDLRMVRTGAFCILFVNGKPSGWAWLMAHMHPEAAIGRVGISLGVGTVVDAQVECFEFGSRVPRPILEPRADMPWMSGQALPGAIIEQEGTYYLYIIGVDARAPGSESGGQARMGVATSADLLGWQVHPAPLLESSGPARTYLKETEMTPQEMAQPKAGDGAWDGLYLFANGAVRAPDGKTIVMYSGFDGRWWRGLGCAAASSPLGKFEPFAGNPVFHLGPKGSWDQGAMHEFDLVRDVGRYILFYAGFDGSGDRGGIATSHDLIHWDRPKEPCFGPQAAAWWDSRHVRPRSLTKVGDTWYLFYEGCNHYPAVDKGKDVWTDTIGLARSKDLRDWEYHPRNPVISQGTSPASIDCRWTGWPRMVIKDGLCYVFHSVRDHSTVRTALRIISLEQLTQWGTK